MRKARNLRKVDKNMARIVVTPELLEGEANRLTGYIGTHESNLQQMRVLVDSLERDWQGETQNAFYAQFKAQERMFENFRLTLENFRNFMNAYARTMRETDAGAAAQIRNF
jgi:WXG100 family type VII secretion target